MSGRCDYSQHDNSSLPVTYSATVLEGGEQVCPPEEQLEMARAEIGQDILDTIRSIYCPGQVQENPAVSCLEIAQCNHQNTTGSQALMEQLFRCIAICLESVAVAMLVKVLGDGHVWPTST